MVLAEMIKICLLFIVILFTLLVFDAITMLFCSIFPKLENRCQNMLLFMKYDGIAILVLVALSMFLNILRNGVVL